MYSSEIAHLCGPHAVTIGRCRDDGGEEANLANHVCAVISANRGVNTVVRGRETAHRRRCRDDGGEEASLAKHVRAIISVNRSVTAVVRGGGTTRRRGGGTARWFVERDGSDEKEAEGFLECHSRSGGVTRDRTIGRKIELERRSDDDRIAKVVAFDLLVNIGGVGP